MKASVGYLHLTTEQNPTLRLDLGGVIIIKLLYILGEMCVTGLYPNTHCCSPEGLHYNTPSDIE